MKNVENKISEAMERLQLLGVKKPNSEKMTREDVVKIMGPLNATFAEIAKVSNEAEIKIQKVMLEFVAKVSEFGLEIEIPAKLKT